MKFSLSIFIRNVQLVFSVGISYNFSDLSGKNIIKLFFKWIKRLKENKDFTSQYAKYIWHKKTND